MKKKTWIISEFYYPINTSTGYYITEIAEYLASKGKIVNVITTNAKYNISDIVITKKNEFKNGVYIHRVLTGNINKNQFLLRTFRLANSSLKLFFKILFSVKKNDNVMVVTNPAFLILLMPIIKVIKKIEYTILVHDVFPENLIAIGKLNDNSIFAIFLKKLYNFSYSKADRCIAIGRDMKGIIEKKIGKFSKIELISNWADVDEVMPIKKENTELFKKIEMSNKLIFQFAGNLGHAQGLSNIFEAIKLIKNNNIHFLFIGSGAMEEFIRDFSQKNKLKNVTLIGFQKRSEQQDFLNACDISIVTLNDGMYGLGVPSKSYNIMAAGKPILIIADRKSEISLCVKEHNIGWTIDPGNPKKLCSLFETIYNDHYTNKVSLNSSRKIAVELFAKKVILEKYNNLFN